MSRRTLCEKTSPLRVDELTEWAGVDEPPEPIVGSTPELEWAIDRAVQELPEPIVRKTELRHCLVGPGEGDRKCAAEDER